MLVAPRSCYDEIAYLTRSDHNSWLGDPLRPRYFEFFHRLPCNMDPHIVAVAAGLVFGDFGPALPIGATLSMEAVWVLNLLQWKCLWPP